MHKTYIYITGWVPPFSSPYILNSKTFSKILIPNSFVIPQLKLEQINFTASTKYKYFHGPLFGRNKIEFPGQQQLNSEKWYSTQRERERTVLL